MSAIILVIHILLAVGIVVLVLMQQGRAGAGGVFGGGASQTFFGSRGSFSMLMKITATMAMGFFVTSLWLSIIAQRESSTNINPSLIRQQQQEAEQEQQLLQQEQQLLQQEQQLQEQLFQEQQLQDTESEQEEAEPQAPINLPIFDDE